jgi:hypothetical protein
VSARKHWESFQSLADTTTRAAIEIAWLYSLRTKNNGRLPRCKSLKSHQMILDGLLALEARGNFGRGDGLFGMADHRKVARQAPAAIDPRFNADPPVFIYRGA